MIKKDIKKNASSFKSEQIVQDVKNHLKSASDLYEQYIESHASYIVDPVTNSEYLKDGWSENVIFNDTLVKKVDDTFSLIFNLTGSKQIILKAALKGDDSYLKPVKITFYVENKVLGSITLQYNYLTNYSITVPSELALENTLITGKVEKISTSTLVYFRSIISVHSDVFSDSFDESLFELERIKRDTTQLFQFLEWHKNPELLLPGSPKKTFAKKVAKKVAGKLLGRFSDSLIIKRIVLKLIRPFTTPQILFNQYLLEIIHLQEKRNDKLEELLLTSLKEQRNTKR